MKFYFSAMSLLRVVVAMIVSAYFVPGADAQASSANSMPQTDESAGLAEVVVTAQRRSEDVQKVPISVAAVSGDLLTAQNIMSMANLAAVVPGLIVTPNVADAQIFVRGIGTTGEGIEGDVGLYIDGVYIPSQSASLINLSNIDHIEVLKGPQGTLFGRNAVGGAIQVVTKDPSHTTSADMSLGYSNYSTGTANFYGTAGLTDDLAVDLAVYGNRQWDGWGTDLVTHEALFTSDVLQIRNKWLFTPTSGTKITLALDYSRESNESGLDWHVLPGAVGIDGKATYLGFYNANSDWPWLDLTTQKGAMLRVDEDFGWARGVSVSSFRNSSAFLSGDQDVTPLPVIRAKGAEKDETFSEELQLLSPEKSSLQWIAGLYFLHDRFGTPGYFVEEPTGISIIDSSTPTTSYAGFGQATVEVLADTHLTVGLRYTHDKKSVSGVVTFDGAPVETGSQSAAFSKVTYRVVVDHQFTPDIFGYVSYDVGFKSGQYNYFSILSPAVNPETLDAWQGGIKTEFLNRRLRINVSGYHYDYKNIQINEVVPGGVTLLNAAQAKLYGADADFQASLTSSFKLQGSLSWEHGRYTSFPSDPSYQPFPGGGNGCFSELSVAGFATPCSINGAGKTTVQTPTATAYLAADYMLPMGPGEVEFNVNESYNSGYYWDPDNRLKQPPYALLGAYAKWLPNGRNYDVQLWAKNITDKKYYTFESAFAFGDIGSPAAPVTYGVTVHAHF